MASAAVVTAPAGLSTRAVRRRPRRGRQRKRMKRPSLPTTPATPLPGLFAEPGGPEGLALGVVELPPELVVILPGHERAPVRGRSRRACRSACRTSRAS